MRGKGGEEKEGREGGREEREGNGGEQPTRDRGQNDGYKDVQGT